jgi:hypothetical protein
MLLPDQSGASPHLAVVEGKGGVLYLVDRDHMGHWQSGNNSHAVQTMAVPDGVFGSMAYWNHYVYVLSDGDALRQFAVIDGKLSPKAASSFRGVSATPTISANSLDDGIVWLLRSKVWNAPDQPAALYAYDAANVAHETLQQRAKCRPGPPRPGPTVQHPDGRKWPNRHFGQLKPNNLDYPRSKKFWAFDTISNCKDLVLVALASGKYMPHG